MRHDSLKYILAAAVVAVAAGCSSTPRKTVEGVIERTFGEVPANVRLVVTESSDSLDRYVLSAQNGVLTVEGSSPVAVCKGFHDYILENGHGIASWTGNRLDFPDYVPSLQRRESVSPFEQRLYQNVCTFGYTSAFWGWEEWEREIDWMALHGFNMPLAPIAGEAVLARVFESFGLSRQEIDEYFTGPAHLPWMRMGNMTQVDGGMSPQWHQSQIDLQHRIIDRMQSLGMTPVYQGFAGFVPKALKNHYPSADITVTKWQGHESYMLSPLDSLFSEIGTAFIREWEKEFGKGKYYLIDSFNELDIPFGEKGSQQRHDRLRHYSQTIYNSLARANPDAVWVMQGWMFGYSRDIWDSQSVEALLSGAPDDRLMVIDLAVDFNNYVWKNGNSWDNLDGFFGKRWIWSTVPNFGGRTALKGPLEFYLNGHLDALRSDSKGRMTGLGTSPEGVENNEILYELISAALWSDSEIDLGDFLSAYDKARYGEENPALKTFWDELRQSVYCNFTNNARFRWQQRPAYHRCPTMNVNEHYFRGIESFLSVKDLYRGNELYEADAVQYAALYLAAKADCVLREAEHAAVLGDREGTLALKDKLVRMLGEADRLLESHPVLRLERLLGFAQASATNEAEAASFAKEAKRLVSTWSGPSLKDYSARVWSGLIRDYYIPRLDLYLTSAAEGRFADIVSLDNTFHYGILGDVCPEGTALLSECGPYEDPLEAACSLVRKYSSTESTSTEVTFWSPQDFDGKPRKRLYLTVPAEDFAAMDGILLSGMRGDEVKVTKVEFRSGPKKLGSVTPKGVSSRNAQARIPFKGPRTTKGLEREVVIHITFEGGPDTWGLISLF